MRGRVVSPAVVPGPDGVTLPKLGPCVACRSKDDSRTLLTQDREWLILCDDSAACAKRYRGGVTPETYAAGLRGELLGVAP